jgi:nitrogen regulatory protein PII
VESLVIMAVVERGKADAVVAQAKKAGARGATIFYGRGTGEHESRKFLNIHIESSKELIIIICNQDAYQPIYDAVVQAGQIRKPGKGVAFTLPITNLVGLEHHRELSDKGKKI